jgi:uncharacterized protein (TIGR03382 family)
MLALALAAIGVPTALFGLALVLLGSERPGADPFAQIGDRKFGPDPVGGVAIALGLAALLLSVLLLRRRGRA